MRSPVHAILMSVLLLVPGPLVKAAQTGCKAGKAQVTVTVRKGEIPIDHGRSMEEMWRLSGRPPSHKLLLNGLYRRQILIKHRLKAPRGCGGRAVVGVEIVLDSKIFLRADMGRNGCFYQVARRHELEHLAIDYRFLRVHGRRLEKALRRELSRIRPPPDQRSLEALVDRRVHQALSAFDRETLPRQNAIDTPRNAQRIYARCGTGRRDPQARDVAAPAPNWVPQTER